MEVSVKKWGNGAAVRIPAKVLNAAQVDIEQRVDVRTEGGKIVIDPIRDSDTLEGLLSQITSENMHREVSFGKLVGNEML